MDVFKIKLRYVLSLGNWLNSLSLYGPESRARTRFVNELQKVMEGAEKDRQVLVQEYADKDEKGNPKLITNDAGQMHYEVPDDKIEEFNTKVNQIYSEEACITGIEMAPTIMRIKNLVLNPDVKIEGSISTDYSAWCDAFEEVN